MSWVEVIIGLLVLILIHEAGHFSVARLVGAKATRFLVGFPPVALSFRRGETEYGIGMIPLGGYVRIVGMNRPLPEDAIICQDAIEEIELRRPEGQRDLLGPATATLRGAIAAGASPAECQTAADRAVLALDADQHLLHPKTYTETRKNLERLRDDLDRRAYWRLPVWKRIAIILAGPGANVLAALVILTVFFWHGVPLQKPSTEVAAVSGAPAVAAGLKPGDTITAVTGRSVHGDWKLVSRDVQTAQGAPVTLTVERDGVTRTLTPVAPRNVDGRWLVGFTFRQVPDGTRRASLPRAAADSARWSWFVTRESVTGLTRIVTTSDGHKQVSSIVGITAASEQSVQDGSFLWMLGVISLALAIFNLLPFLPLDGGHIVVALAEKLRHGRPLSRVLIERVSIVGIALVMVLFFVGLSNDISRFTGP
ncbi:MAG: M50 family metallopeptidase [Gaiellales bacterium]